VAAPRPPIHPVRFIALMDADQSIAINSTSRATRNGTGTALVTFDPLSGDLSYDITFRDLIGPDITVLPPGGDPTVNPDGSIAAPGTINGFSLPGGGLFLLHFHVGAVGFNGPIPVDIVARTGPAIGVLTTDPTPIQGATAGRVTGRVNIFDLAMNGFLLNNVPVDGRNDADNNATGVGDGFIEGILSGNAYVNIHTFNNPFGEVRGQLSPLGCETSNIINTIEGLRNSVRAVEASGGRVGNLDAKLVAALRARDAKRNGDVRRLLAEFIEEVAARLARNRIESLDGDALICGASNVISLVTPAR
jgi:hypothetical protein